MKITTFKATEQSQAKHDRNYDPTEKKPNVTKKTERQATMLICGECGKDWNHHAGHAPDGVPAGMCLTEANFALTGTYLIEE
jgi:hypothetical protein